MYKYEHSQMNLLQCIAIEMADSVTTLQNLQYKLQKLYCMGDTIIKTVAYTM